MKSKQQIKQEVRKFLAWRRKKLAEAEMRDVVDEMAADERRAVFFDRHYSVETRAAMIDAKRPRRGVLKHGKMSPLLERSISR